VLAGKPQRDKAMLTRYKKNNTFKCFSHGQIIVAQGFSGQAMGLIKEGQVEIFKKSADGEDTVLKTLKKNDMFGIGSLFGDDQRQTGVRAVNKVLVTLMDRRDFIRRIHKEPQVAFNVLESLCYRIKQMSEEVQDKKNVRKN
ncbi:MAG: cyclic nucleotide-binding domain-containing protein, partial [Gammaproteobacteria bacterium]|nr:cyclic nucleotide-binding domain-containing protein [Gammaproteobacteria bacterium]